MHDVFAYGVVAPSTLYELSGDFPAAAGYGEIVGVHPSIGGEAAGSAYVLARLGVAAKLDGNRLHDDGEARRTLELLTGAGVDCSAITVDRQTPPLTEVVMASGGDRTIFGTYSRLLADQSWNEPTKADVLASRIVCLDPFFGDASRAVARWCREAALPYVSVDAAPDTDIAGGAEVLIVAEEFASRTFADPASPEEIIAAYKAHCRGLVILTRGSKPLLYQRDSPNPQESAPFLVDARDTAGAGDSFRAGIIYGMLHDYDDPALIATASAVAALVCRRVPGVVNSPTESELHEFLDRTQHPSN